MLRAPRAVGRRVRRRVSRPGRAAWRHAWDQAGAGPAAPRQVLPGGGPARCRSAPGGASAFRASTASLGLSCSALRVRCHRCTAWPPKRRSRRRRPAWKAPRRQLVVLPAPADHRLVESVEAQRRSRAVPVALLMPDWLMQGRPASCRSSRLRGVAATLDAAGEKAEIQFPAGQHVARALPRRARAGLHEAVGRAKAQWSAKSRCATMSPSISTTYSPRAAAMPRLCVRGSRRRGPPATGGQARGKSCASSRRAAVSARAVVADDHLVRQPALARQAAQYQPPGPRASCRSARRRSRSPSPGALRWSARSTAGDGSMWAWCVNPDSAGVGRGCSGGGNRAAATTA